MRPRRPSAAAPPLLCSGPAALPSGPAVLLQRPRRPSAAAPPLLCSGPTALSSGPAALSAAAPPLLYSGPAALLQRPSRAAQQQSSRAAPPPSRAAAEPPGHPPAEPPCSRPPSRRAAQLPSRPTTEPPSSRAALQLSRPSSPVCVLAFYAEGRAINFEVGVDDLQLFLQCDRADGLSLFDLTSGASPAPAADADATVRSQWATRDAAARLAVRRHLPTSERAHFSQYKSAQTLYDAVVARYSSPSTAALSRLMLPYLFPDLAAFPTVADLITHLRTSDTRYRAALPADFCTANPPPNVYHSVLPSHSPP
ncbi:unnamed protein product [Closterium sp. NIES-65]|nr:unnamed protein product [Closterium sp. NIES-65]